MRHRLLSVAAVAAALAVAGSARAHEVGLSKGGYRVIGATLQAGIDIGDADLGEGPEALVAGLTVTSSGTPCPGSLIGAEPSSDDGRRVRMHYVCPAPPTDLTLVFGFVEGAGPSHRHLYTLIAGGRSWNGVAWRQSLSATFRIDASAPPDAAGPDATGPTVMEVPSFWAFVVLGVEHILIGIDHLLFLLALVLVGVAWKQLLLVVTAFTVAHSITLAVAVLGIWAPSPDVVEPLIALSIAWVGAENFFVEDASRRWRITFPFGLIHGFGFAGALAETGLLAEDAALPLIGFNLGVEAGQILVLLPVLPLVLWLGRAAWFGRRGVRAVSAGVVAVGLYWFVERTAGALGG